MVELLAPAGDLEKLKIALLYGADACYIGGESFSLRARASNFTLEDIAEATKYAHAHAKRVYVTTNIIPHHEDLSGVKEYLEALEACGVDAVISASPYIIDLAHKHTSLEIHLSTQQSVTNGHAMAFWKKRGVKRIVLARELSLEDIKAIKEITDTDIEVFVHGGMCMSYSGRCSLSDTMTFRDANRGGCAHSCRWIYELSSSEKTYDKPFSMASKDLSAYLFVPGLIDAGVGALKIEGRMKSLHYIATVVSTYRRMIDDYLQYGRIDDFSRYARELGKAENRPTAVGFLGGMPGPEEQLFEQSDTRPAHVFIGIVLSYDTTTKEAVIEQRNHFQVGETIEILHTDGSNASFLLASMTDEDGQPIAVAPHPQQRIRVKIPFPVEPNAMVRKK